MAWQTDAERRLREAGHRSGAARSAVLAHLADQSCCSSAQELHGSLAAGGARVGLATVYRVLDTLAELDLVQRVDLGDGVARFEPTRLDEHHHHHLLCDECGRVEQFEDPGLEAAIEAVEGRSGFVARAHEVVLRGACADCRVR